jgi:hypothetical protein
MELAERFGTNVITPNMHFQLHLVDCVRDFGPLHSFWLFSFERFNGLLGSYPNSGRSVQAEFMDNWMERCRFADVVDYLSVNNELHQVEAITLHSLRDDNSTRDFTNQTRHYTKTELIEYLELAFSPNPPTGFEAFPGSFVGASIVRDANDDILQCLVDFYQNAYDPGETHLLFAAPDDNPPLNGQHMITITPTIRVYYRLQILRDIFGSATKPRFSGSAAVKLVMEFSELNSDVQQLNELQNARDLALWVGIVQFYFEHELLLPRSVAKDLCGRPMTGLLVLLTASRSLTCCSQRPTGLTSGPQRFLRWE